MEQYMAKSSRTKDRFTKQSFPGQLDVGCEVEMMRQDWEKDAPKIIVKGNGHYDIRNNEGKKK